MIQAVLDQFLPVLVAVLGAAGILAYAYLISKDDK